MKYEYDLHIHTTASDGVLTPQEVIDKAVEIGLKGIAISDHDTVAGLEKARQYLNTTSYCLDFIPAVELNTEAEKEEVHILGYFIDPQNAALNQRLQDIRISRYHRSEQMVSRLQEAGLKINFTQVKELAQGESIGRPHVARALINNNYVASIDEAFEKYIGWGAPGYVPRYKFLPAEAIELIKNAGGIAVLAHPGLIKNKKKVLDIINLGIEGLEVFYPEHSPEQIEELLRLARRYHLLLTGGSDYHGPGGAESRANMGSAGVSKKLADQLYTYLNFRE
ncbi:MAG: PHP domain-containing protein [Syntrophomonadaceae bacterium]|nr:PHP domain-containing protein [Syntrophomonadaceae bacterium]MDD3270486.1 PHP domain-containing protein [Syntrophomonadaceae bacterium]MDD3897512.1 PHP domain-containing protein [Syntrophomonadaceae bacterium]MDD4561530.1 PHP domain-containing protein [Syntrophomonadaceae bacterium]